MEPCGRERARDRDLRKGTGTVGARRAASGEPSPGADVGRGESDKEKLKSLQLMVRTMSVIN